MERPLFNQVPNPNFAGSIRTESGSWKDIVRAAGLSALEMAIATDVYEKLWVPLIEEARARREDSVDIELGDLSTSEGRNYHDRSVSFAKQRHMLSEVALILAHGTETKSRHVLRITLEYKD